MDTQVKKDEHLEIKKKSFEHFFYFLNVRPFSSGGFFTFLVALAHGVSLLQAVACLATGIYIRGHFYIT